MLSLVDKVRAITPDGTIKTVAGTGRQASGAEPVPAGAKGTDIALGSPSSLAVGADGTLYIADLATIRVYAMTADGVVSVRVGAGVGTPLDPPMGPPTGLAAAPDGTVYVGDHDNNRILAVAPGGAVSVVAGNGSLTAAAAGGPATQVPVGAPNGLAVDAVGDLWISGGLLLRRLHADQITTVTAPATGEWGTADGATRPPAEPPMNNVQSVSAVPKASTPSISASE
jgi:sugar lactone lactonase YvrE